MYAGTIRSKIGYLLVFIWMGFLPGFVSAQGTKSVRDTRTAPSPSAVPNPTFFQGILFAELFPGGVPDAIRACPSAGCIVYAISPSVNRNLGSIDPGNKAVTIYLGPYIFNVKQITLRKSFKLVGMGASDNGTRLQSINGNDAVVVLPQANNAAASNVLLSGFRLLGSVGNTSEDGFFLDTSSTVNSGLWYSILRDIYMQGFAGIALHLRGHSDNYSSMSQWVHFENVFVYRTPNGGNALRLEGSNFELRFTNCEFDGQSPGDGTNIFIGGLAGGIDGFPLSIIFEGLVTQAAALAVQIDGAANVTFYGSHHEKLWGAYQVNNDFDIWTKGLTIADTFFAGNVGNNSGAGYLLNVTTSLATGITFSHNRITGDPDAVVTGTNLASIIYQDNFYAGTAAVPPTSGITAQLTPADTIDIAGAHSIALNPSPIPITTIRSSLGPGEMVTLFVLGTPVTFASGGNLNLMGATSVSVDGSITFIRTDWPSSQWTPVSEWSPRPTALLRSRPGQPIEPR